MDEGTLLLSNLEELVLTGNFITLLSTACLPAKIKVIAISTVFIVESRVCLSHKIWTHQNMDPYVQIFWARVRG